VADEGYVGDITGVSGGVGSPTDGVIGVVAALVIETVAMTWFNKTLLHRLNSASPTYKSYLAILRKTNSLALISLTGRPEILAQARFE
jgi:hypothetical protein